MMNDASRILCTLHNCDPTYARLQHMKEKKTLVGSPGRSSKRIQDVQCDKGGLDLEEQRVSRPDNSLTCFSLYRFVGTNVYYNGF